MKKFEFKFFSDPGHGWLKVLKNDMEQYFCCEDIISPFSYQDSKAYYLEEDYDMRNFIKLLDMTEVKYEIVEVKPAKFSSHIRDKQRVRSYINYKDRINMIFSTNQKSEREKSSFL